MKLVMSIVILLIFQLSLIAGTVPTKENVTKLYVATFNRAPDAAGLNYWVTKSGLNLESIAKSFFDQPETQETYPPESSTEDFVKAVYENLFNRASEQAGLDYWVAELDSGRIAKSVFIQAVINGAQNTIEFGNDATILSNKTIVGLSFVQAGLENVDDAKIIMANISDDKSSIISALDEFGISLYLEASEGEEIILFTIVSGGVNTSGMTLDGEYTSWSSTTHYLFKYEVLTKILTNIDSDTSFSYASSTYYPMTKNDTLYTITGLSGIDIKIYDLQTLATSDTNLNVWSEGYNNFAIVNDKVFYIEKYSNNLMVTSIIPGEIFLPEPTVLFDGDHSPIPLYGLYGVNSNLLSFYYDMNSNIVINRHDLSTGEVIENLITMKIEKYFYNIFDGDEAIYWGEYDDATRILKIVQLKLDGSLPKYIFSTEIDELYNLTVDDSNGKVFIAYQDWDTEVPYFYMVDPKTCAVRTLDIDSTLFSHTAKGMQFSYIPGNDSSVYTINYCP